MSIACYRSRGMRMRARVAIVSPAIHPPGFPPTRAAAREQRVRLAPILSASTALATLLATPAFAAPQGGSVVSGTATISTSGTTTNVNQSTNKAIINWTAFSVAASETVNFNQPSAASVTLNRVIGNESSVIAGAINANGQVFLVNSNGILFTGTSQVNVGGFVASTLDINNADFIAGNYVFSGSSTASVVNKGNISAASGGYVSLLGRSVSNEGVITATLGTVSLNAASKMTLNFEGNSLVDVTLDEGVLNALVENKQLIKADGGKVIMTAKAADAVLSAQVNNTGIIQARAMAQLTGGTTTYKKGSIALKADGGTTKVSGTIDASAPNGGDGGSIETSGNTVKIDEAATITTLASSGTTGSWLIDPDGFTIGNRAYPTRPWHRWARDNGGDISASKLSSLLATTNVEIQSTDGRGTDGDINVNAAVSWAANTTLTLTATNDININAPITATGKSAGLNLNYGGDYYIANGAAVTLNGANASLAMNGQAYTLIHTMAQLAALDDATGTASGLYAIANDIDASDTSYDGALVARLSGTLAGLGHTVSGLIISSGGSYVGLIGSVGSDSTVRDLGLLDVDITGNSTVGALAGENNGVVSNSYATGAVTSLSSGWAGTGGLIGENYGTIAGSHAAVAVTSSGNYVGGLVGYSYGLITGSYATGDVSGYMTVGGLIGGGGGTVSDAYATGDVTGNNYVGGLAGTAGGTYTNVYATGNVTGVETVGGLIGYSNGVTLNTAYASGNVTGAGQDVGGLLGMSNYGTLTNVSASGAVTNTGSYTGGLVGRTDGTTISNASFSGTVTGAFGTGGIAGFNGGTITDAQVTGSVTGTAAVGGIAGLNLGGTIRNVLFAGSVTGLMTVGGVAGASTGIIDNATSTGTVSGRSNVGGIAGNNLGGITNSSVTGAVSGTENTGGLVGNNIGSGEVSNSTWNTTSTGQAGGVGNGEGIGTSVLGVTPPPIPAYATDAVQSAVRAATVNATIGVQETADNPRFARQAAAGTSATAALAGPSVASQIDSSAAPAPTTSWRQLQEQEERRRKRAAQQARPAATPTGGYGGAIRSIDVDGQHFELERDTAPETPAPAQPATPAQ
ncbi:GLUG motif-containing protein [Xanthobacter oligotrophicus]|uniref:two-partner secretion domain-containing protein n=1 Tax=Xanthobacter oligotrophicus TaxID=2607286 RepID=UPI0011F2A9B9|nr:GLUG motif-containing protein [Xanthobacter oligotrophicus]MCG5237945.1 filamentous hemagglutinin N-terminal domain-containing protein [Xanthobacter oligotrophicus]